jgi:hypothetical protein
MVFLDPLGKTMVMQVLDMLKLKREASKCMVKERIYQWDKY